MERVHDMAEALGDLLGREDPIWLATHLRLDEDEPSDAWVRRIDIPDRFYQDLSAAMSSASTLPVEVASHELSGSACVRRQGKRCFIEWDVSGESINREGIWGSFMILVLLRDRQPFSLWCWICDTDAEVENGEMVFGYAPIAGFAYGAKSPASIELLSR